MDERSSSDPMAGRVAAAGEAALVNARRDRQMATNANVLSGSHTVTVSGGVTSGAGQKASLGISPSPPYCNVLSAVKSGSPRLSVPKV